MKKFIVPLLFVLVLAGCTPTPETAEEESLLKSDLSEEHTHEGEDDDHDHAHDDEMDKEMMDDEEGEADSEDDTTDLFGEESEAEVSL